MSIHKFTNNLITLIINKTALTKAFRVYCIFHVGKEFRSNCISASEI